MKKIVFLYIAFFSVQFVIPASISAQILFYNAYNLCSNPRNANTYCNSTAPIYQYITDIGKTPNDYFYGHHINCECLAYFLDTTKGKKIKISSVVVYDYRAKDSVHRKKLQNKCQIQFNEKGQMTYLFNVNQEGEVTDSERMCYDKAYKLLSDIQYTTGTYNSKGKINWGMQKIEAEYYIYDTSGHEIKDSIWYISGGSSRLGAPTISEEFKTYDSAGNELTDILVVNSENKQENLLTEYTIYQYDDHNRIVDENFHSTQASSRIEHYKYDTNTGSNKIDELNDKLSLQELVMPTTHSKPGSNTVFIDGYRHDSTGHDVAIMEKEFWLSNEKNKMVSYRLYDSSICGSNPYETDSYVYYPDSVSLKKHTYTDYDNNFKRNTHYCIAYFGEDSRILKYSYLDYIYLDYREIVYEYKK